MMQLRCRLRQACLFVLCALTFMCSSLDNITVDETSETVVPARTLVEELVGNLTFLGFEGFDIEQSEEFQSGGYTKDQIDSVHLLSLSLEVLAPSTGNFDWLESVTFFAEAEGLPRIPIAHLSDIEDGQAVLNLEIDEAELLEYVISPSVTIATEATGLRPEEETTIKASVVLDVDINVDGSLGC